MLYLVRFYTKNWSWTISPDSSGYAILNASAAKAKMAFERMAGPKVSTRSNRFAPKHILN